MKPRFSDDTVTLYAGDCREALPTLPDASVDVVVTDPPYELGFMGRAWDSSGIAYNVEVWRECLRVLKPGGHLLAFGGTRTYHRLVCAIEDANFEIRDSMHWIYGSGFPKSLDVSKAIDKAAHSRPLWDAIRAHIREWRDRNGMSNPQLNAALGLATDGSGMARHWTSEVGGQHQIPSKENWQRLKTLLGWPDCDLDAVYEEVKDGALRPVVGQRTTGIGTGRGAVAVIGDSDNRDLTAPATDDARRWSGFGTALKPAHEPIVLARKSLGGTVAANVLAHGTGALNIDACRVGWDAESLAKDTARRQQPRSNITSGRLIGGDSGGYEGASASPAGRWPTNVVLTHQPLVDDTGNIIGDACAGGCVPGCPVADMDAQSGVTRSSGGTGPLSGRPGQSVYGTYGQRQGTNAGGLGDVGGASRFFPVFRYEAKAPSSERPRAADGTAHATVKPLALMRWLVRLATQPGGIVLDPFLGSGTTAEACVIEGFRCIGIERDESHLPLIKARLSKPIQPALGFEDAS